MTNSRQKILAHQQLLTQFGITEPVVLGKGMQSIVYDFNHNQVIKIYLDSSINIDHRSPFKNDHRNNVLVRKLVNE